MSTNARYVKLSGADEEAGHVSSNTTRFIVGSNASLSDDDSRAITDSDETITPMRQPEHHSVTTPLLAGPSIHASGGHTKASTPHGGRLSVHADGQGYSYSYGPSGLAGLLHNPYALACAVFASLGGLTFGYDQGVIANVLVMEDFNKRWPIGPWEQGILTAVLELGALTGTLSAGIISHRISRQYSILLACLIFCIGSALQCFASTFIHLILGRAIGGIGVGALSMLSPLYMAEISPPEVRGSLMALEQFAIVLGVVMGFWLGFFTRAIPGSASWRIPLGVQLIPGILLGMGSLFLPSSPRLLVLQNQNEEALKSLARLRLRSSDRAEDDPLLQIELLEMRVETTLIQRSLNINEQKGGLHAELHAWSRLFNHEYRARTLIGVLMMFFQQWSGINALLYFGPIIVKEMGMQGDTITLIVSGGIGITQFFAVLPAIVYIDRLGRKPLLRGGSAVMAFSHLCIALLVHQYESSWASHAGAAWTCVGFAYLFTAAYGMSYGPVGWVLPSEIFPLAIRSQGVALSTASNWVNNFLIGLITPGLMNISSSTTFMIFACACSLGYIWSTYFVPETANVSLEEIDAVFKSSTGQEDRNARLQIERELGLTELISSLSEADYRPDH